MESVLRARVKQGRLVLDEPTDLPEGAEVELTVSGGDDLDDDDRRQLHAALDQADAELRSGLGIPAERVVAELRRRRTGRR